MPPDPSSAHHVILCLNSGSSSLKFALYDLGAVEEVRLAHGAVEHIGLAGGHLWIWGMDNDVLVDVQRDFPGHMAAAEGVSAAAKDLGFPPPVAVGHRVVHGGPDHTAPERVDAQLLAELRSLVPFAPLHLPSAIQGIEAVAARFPGLPQVACFDTAFHCRMPEVARRFPLSRDLWQEGIRRYGFHGLSYEYIVATLGAAAQGRLVIAHLGNGASLAAVLNGQPLDTTMGFTPTGGLMMGTRSGDLDPGVLIHLMHAKGYDAGQLDELVNRQAGLLGVSGLSPDMKTLLEQREREPHAAQAVELFCYQLRKHIGSLAAALGGLDTLVFTGGIGERAAPVRLEVCRGLAYLGIDLDPRKNAVHADVISTPGSDCTVRVIPTNEDLMIARHTRTLLVSTAAAQHP
jgi:acetate kinase